mgnify:CR=1 FL=1
MRDLLLVLALVGFGVLVWLLSSWRRRIGGVVPPPLPRPSTPKQVFDAVDHAETVAKELSEPVEVKRDDVEGLIDGNGDEPDLDVLCVLRGD